VLEDSSAKQLSIKLVRPSRHQVRTRDVEKDLEELVDNIRVNGQLQPIVVSPTGEDGYFEIIAGQRRWLAMQRLQFEVISAIVLTDAPDEMSARAMSLSENMIRRDVGEKDLIDACTALYRRYGSMKIVAEELGLPYNRVRELVKYERLRPELQRRVDSGTLDISSGLRIENYLDSNELDSDELDSLVDAVKDMTAAQQRHFLEHGAGGQIDSSSNADVGLSSIDQIHQIIVTLRRTDHQRLKVWAKSQGLNQDAAASKIIRAFFRARDAEANMNDRSGGAARPHRPR
jgi:ParB family transcriptional regulator, chromosome partitioning protein